MSVTRFPPEPNGHLHLGHAKAMYINFNYDKNGIVNLRFDDTNPLKEKDIYVNSILEDVEWLGYKPDKITYTSDYFDKLYEYAIQLIKMDKAYVCELTSDRMKFERKNNIDSPFRIRPINESLKIFQEMKNGVHDHMTLRLKGDMSSNNPTLRDMVAYRIIRCEHARVKNWVIYPTYDFSHPIVDSLEGITHSFCSIEFKSRNELYRWISSTLNINAPPQIEYSRLNVSNVILSKRKILELIDNNSASGWDDPLLATLKGLKRKGFTPEAINDFCHRIGTSIGTTGTIVHYELLEECLRKDLNTKVPRILAILNPLKIIILNFSDMVIKAMDFPDLPNTTTREIKVGSEIYIDKEDFRVVDSKNYYRLAPNKIVKLKYLGYVKCVEVKKDIYVEFLPDFKPDKKIKGILNWVSEIDHVKIKIRKFNINNTEIVEGLCDSSILLHNTFQFERIGYFHKDIDSTPDNIIMNMTAPLKANTRKNL